MKNIKEVIDISIDAVGYIISDVKDNMVDFSGLDFEKMRRDFKVS